MLLTRLELAGTPPTTVCLTNGLNVIDSLVEDDLTRTRCALVELFGGSLTFGRAWMSIDGIEIEISPEIAALLPSAIREQPMVDPSGLGQTHDPTLVAIRAALEVLGAIPDRLTLGDVEQALTTSAQRHRDLIAEAEDRVRTASAVDAKAELALTDLRQHFARKIEFERRRLVPRRKRLDEVERAATDATARAEADRRDAAQALRLVIEDLVAVRDRSSHRPAVRQLVAWDYALTLRRHQMLASGQLLDADRRGLVTALDVLRPVDERRLSADPVSDVALWLLHQEHRSDDDAFVAHAARHCTPHPTLGILPLIVDGTSTPVVRSGQRLRTVVEEFTDSLQVIHLGSLAA